MVGALIQLGQAINPSHYNGTAAADTIQEEVAARLRLRQFMLWMSKSFVLVIDEYWVSTNYVFLRFMVDLASAIFGYLHDRTWLHHEAPACTAIKFKLAVLRFIRQDYPELEGKLVASFAEPTALFTWTGPDFQIHYRPVLPPSVITQEHVDFPADPIYLDNGSGAQLPVEAAAEETVRPESEDGSNDSDEDTGEDEEEEDDEPGQPMDIDVPTTPPQQTGTRRPQPGSAGKSMFHVFIQITTIEYIVRYIPNSVPQTSSSKAGSSLGLPCSCHFFYKYIFASVWSS